MYVEKIVIFYFDIGTYVYDVLFYVSRSVCNK